VVSELVVPMLAVPVLVVAFAVVHSTIAEDGGCWVVSASTYSMTSMDHDVDIDAKVL
jgi:hypothetical protein